MTISWTVLKLQSERDFVLETATYKVQRGITQKVSIQELWFLHSAPRFMLVNIYMKFHEGILNVFLVTERTQPYCKIYYFQFQRAITPKICIPVTDLELCTSSHVALHLCKVSRKYFLSYRADDFVTDGQTYDPGKNNMSPNPKGGRHTTSPVSFATIHCLDWHK